MNKLERHKNQYLDWAIRKMAVTIPKKLAESLGLKYANIEIELTEEEIEFCHRQAKEKKMNFDQFIEFVISQHMDILKLQEKNTDEKSN